MTTEPMTPDLPENSAEVGIDVQRLVLPSLNDEQMDILRVCGHPYIQAAQLIMTSADVIELIEMGAVRAIADHPPHGYRISARGVEIFKQNVQGHRPHTSQAAPKSVTGCKLSGSVWNYKQVCGSVR